jgi:hypothetical protein
MPNTRIDLHLMEQQQLVMTLGFALAAYSVIGNDVIQTLGTFLSSNERRPWYVLFLFAGTILAAVLIYGWYAYSGDVSYGRLIGEPPKYTPENPKYPLPSPFGYIYLLPTLVLLGLTRLGIPVSTSFMILTFFAPKNLYDMVVKSMSGYMVAFVSAMLLYSLVVPKLEKRFLEKPLTEAEMRWWTIAQWGSTGFLWSRWLVQDFANIYVYLPRLITFEELMISLAGLLAMLAFIFYSKGGAVQKVVKSKTNTEDIRSATFIDLIYGLVLLFFEYINPIPMSTTWVFVGLLAGRELSLQYALRRRIKIKTWKSLGKDLLKIFLGLVISIGLVFLINAFK